MTDRQKKIYARMTDSGIDGSNRRNGARMRSRTEVDSHRARSQNRWATTTVKLSALTADDF